MGIELFEHNRKAYDSAISLMNETGKAAVIHPTGTGKSFIGFKLAEEYPNGRICWVSPSEYIFKTQIDNLKSVTDGYISKNIIFITYAKLMLLDADAIAEIKPDFIVLDEFHRAGARIWMSGVKNLINAYPNASLLGLSATNIRFLDNYRDMAEELFQGAIASVMTLGEAVTRGILLTPRYVISVYSMQKELEKYKKRLENSNCISVREKSQKKLDGIFEKYIKERNGKYIVFCANKKHLKDMLSHVEEWFSKVDKEPHIYVTYHKEPASRKEFDKFKRDDSEHLKLLYCIDMLNEGVHVDDISCVMLFRPTVAPIIYKQQIGRALSAKKGKEPIIFDIVNNFENLYSIGSIEEEMAEAAVLLRENGEEDRIVFEHFKIIDETLDCKRLFDELQSSLYTSWDDYYEACVAYKNENRHINIPF